MGKKILLQLFLITFILSRLISVESKPIVKNANSDQVWKRHYFDVCGTSGFASIYYSFTDNKNHEEFNVTRFGIGTLVGISFGYQYAFTPYFAFGPGLSGFLTIIPGYHYTNTYSDGTSIDGYNTLKNGDGDNYISLESSAGAVMCTFIFGDLRYKKIAFLLDVGGGWIATTKLGLYYKGFIVKAGYTLSYLGYGHNITLDFGYKFNWAGKQAIAKAPVKETKPIEPVKEENKVEQLKDAKEGEVIRFDDIIFFPDIDTIKQSSYPVLDKIAQVLKERKDLSIEIGGYTNSTGKPKDELLLSTNRAMKVATYLIEKGIDAGRLKTAGYGSLNLKQATIDEANRRVEIKILKVGK